MSQIQTCGPPVAIDAPWIVKGFVNLLHVLVGVVQGESHAQNDYSTQPHAVAAIVALLVALLGARHTVHASDQGASLGGFERLRVIGLTDDGRLVRFRAGSPRKTSDIGYVYGLKGNDTALVGIDSACRTGSCTASERRRRLHDRSRRRPRRQFVNALTVPLRGLFGVDFNPAADRLRIVSDTGQNLAHNVNAGGVTVSNATLTYTAPPADAGLRRRASRAPPTRTTT